MGKNYSFSTNKESLKNQKLSYYEIMDFILDYMNNHIDSTQKDSMIDRIMDFIKYTKFRTYN